jgi:hypothetical protein
MEEDHGKEKEMVTGDVIISKHVFYSFIYMVGFSYGYALDIVLPYYLIT